MKHKHDWSPEVTSLGVSRNRVRCVRCNALRRKGLDRTYAYYDGRTGAFTGNRSSSCAVPSNSTESQEKT